MSDFEDIRPYHDEEVAAVLAELVADPALLSFVSGWLAPRLHRLFPGMVEAVLRWYLRRAIRHVNDINGFQEIVASYARKLVRDGTTSFSYEGFEQLSKDRAYLFVSNHRDIAGDSMLLDYALYLNGLDTVRIAIGDNLVQREFATSLMRLNKGFFIKRSIEGPRAAYAALLQSSQYIKHSIETGNSVWIAQSEGRSKDGLDQTDPAIIKMFLLADRKKPISETISALNIVPLSISYEFDPCDVLKATELGTRAREGGYEKPPGEDLVSLVRGLTGVKGRVVLRLGTPISGQFDSAEEVAAAIDQQIVSKMAFYPVNYWALSKLDEPPYDALAEKYATEVNKKDALELTQRLRACPPDYRKFWLKMYANPVVNREQLLSKTSPPESVNKG